MLRSWYSKQSEAEKKQNNLYILFIKMKKVGTCRCTLVVFINLFLIQSTLSKATFSNYLSYWTVFEDEEKKCCNVNLLKWFKNTNYNKPLPL